MQYRVREIASLLGAEYAGDGEIKISAVMHPENARSTDLAVAMSDGYLDAVRATSARVAVLWPDADWRDLGLDAAIFASRPRFAMAGLTGAFALASDIEPGISAKSEIHATAVIGKDVRVAPFAVIGADVEIGEGTIIGNHVSISAGSKIGAGAILHAGVSIGRNVQIGARFIAQPHAVIGSDGFSFTTPERNAIEDAKRDGALSASVAYIGEGRVHARIHSLGGVEIGDDVEIGANSSIDAGTLAPTRIGDGTKIDNLVQIGHNVVIGTDCLLCGHVGIAGSAIIGDRVVLAGRVGVADHIKIGNDAIVGAASGVGGDIPASSIYMGTPAIERKEWGRIYMATRRLPRLLDKLRN